MSSGAVDPNPTKSASTPPAAAGGGPLGKAFSEALRSGTLWRRPAGPGLDAVAEAVGARSLLIFVQGLNGWLGPQRGSGARYEQALRSLLEPGRALDHADLLPVNYPNGLLTPGDPNEAAAAIDRQISDAVRAHGYMEVRIFAHSAGGLLTRAALLSADEAGDSVWLPRLRRTVFAAASHRGFVVQPHEFFTKGAYQVVLFLFDVLNLWGILGWFGLFKIPMGAMRESAWTGNLRLRWHWAFTAKPGKASVPVVHLVGKDDQLVGPDDDAEPFRYPATEDVPVAKARHESWTSPDAEAAAALAAAFAADATPDDAEKALGAQRPTGKTRLAFLVHGIRDYGEWEAAIEDAVRKQVPALDVVKVRYGYFSALQFAVTDLRRQSVRSFRMHYLEQILRRADLRPEDIAAMGHSNGTYALGEFLRSHDAAGFGRVLTAGSVLPRAFPWRGLNVGVVRNECGVRDCPVGFLSNALSWMFGPFRTIGTAGFHGFEFPSNFNGRNSFGPGGHSQVFEARGYPDRIAAFLLGGEWPCTNAEMGRGYWLWNKASFLVVFLVAAALCWFGWACWPFWLSPSFWTAAACLLLGLLFVKI